MKWCRIHRMLGGVFPEENGLVVRMSRRHAARCLRCREALEREHALTESLRRSAPPVPGELPPFLKGRILSNLDRSSAGRVSWAGWRWVQPWAVAGLCLALLIAFWPRPGPDVKEPGPSMVSSATDEPVAAWLVGSTDVSRWAELASQPLAGEFENAVQDGRRLFAAAVQSVVPEAAAERILAQTDSWLVMEP